MYNGQYKKIKVKEYKIKSLSVSAGAVKMIALQNKQEITVEMTVRAA